MVESRRLNSMPLPAPIADLVKLLAELAFKEMQAGSVTAQSQSAMPSKEGTK